MILPTIFIYLSLCMKDLSYSYVFCCILMHDLVNVVIDVCIEAEYRWCARHIFEIGLRDIGKER